MNHKNIMVGILLAEKAPKTHMLSVMCNGEYMEYLKLNNIIRVLSVGFLIALINKFGFASSMGTVFILTPYLLLFLLANQAAYKTKFRIIS